MQYDEAYEKDTLRELVWFTKKRGKFVGKEQLKDINILQLRAIFNITDPFEKDENEPYDPGYDPYMIDCYSVKELHANALQAHVAHKIKLDKYDYFVEATAN